MRCRWAGISAWAALSASSALRARSRQVGSLIVAARRSVPWVAGAC